MQSAKYTTRNIVCGVLAACAIVGIGWIACSARANMIQTTAGQLVDKQAWYLAEYKSAMETKKAVDKAKNQAIEDDTSDDFQGDAAESSDKTCREDSLWDMSYDEAYERAAAALGENCVMQRESGELVYCIQAGDTLSGIAEALDVSICDLVSQNHIQNPNRIYTGAWLILVPAKCSD